ncbi:hypothetical protein MX01_100 [Escherichia phage MX01]|uniref:Uncharacterized protein n=1 Tax=Escherichia phage MX01 TaxID=1837930 RepID=A0A172Q287_9CAUD|nr:hypothetical protein BOW90_gp100 [Escherichia phage MX01]AND76045.1 hypothetical protein MX01_100 [Escherichia phage MX01]
MITHDQKFKIISLVGDIVEAERELSFEVNSEYGDADTYYELVKVLTEADNALDNYLESLIA